MENWVEDMVGEPPKVMAKGKNPGEYAGWIPPHAGMVAANVDAAWIANRATFAVVVRNFKGEEMLLVAAMSSEAESAEMAELSAVNWASALLEEKGWSIRGGSLLS